MVVDAQLGDCGGQYAEVLGERTRDGGASKIVLSPVLLDNERQQASRQAALLQLTGTQSTVLGLARMSDVQPLESVRQCTSSNRQLIVERQRQAGESGRQYVRWQSCVEGQCMAEVELAQRSQACE